NLVRAGHEVTVWNRTRGKGVEGARVAASPAEAVQGTEVVWLCVSDTAAVESILFGPNGVEQSLAEGMIISDSSTIAPAATRKFAPSGQCFHGEIRSCRIQSAVRVEPRFCGELPAAAYAQGHSPGARGRQRSPREASWIGNRRRNLRNGNRRRPL